MSAVQIPVAAALTEWCSTPDRSFSHHLHGTMHQVILAVDDVAARVGWGPTYNAAVRDALSDRGLSEARKHNAEMRRLYAATMRHYERRRAL